MMLGREHSICVFSDHNSRPHLVALGLVEHISADYTGEIFDRDATIAGIRAELMQVEEFGVFEWNRRSEKRVGEGVVNSPALSKNASMSGWLTASSHNALTSMASSGTSGRRWCASPFC